MTSNAIPTDWDTAYPAQRRMMVECQVRTFDVTDHAILDAMLTIPREAFVDPKVAPLAYADRSLPSVGGKRQMLPPMVLARMLQAAEVRRSDKVLDVAGGSGYSAAILARLSDRVAALESDEMVGVAARTELAVGSPTRIDCVSGPLQEGHAAGAPFDVIVVNGAVEEMSAQLLAQLSDGGRLIAIDAGHGAPRAVRYERVGADISVRPLFDASAHILEGFSRVPAFVF